MRYVLLINQEIHTHARAHTSAFFIHFSQRAGNLLRLSCVSARYRVACIQSTLSNRSYHSNRNHSFQDEYSLRHFVILKLIRAKINAPPAPFKSHYRSNIGIKLGAQYIVFLHVESQIKLFRPLPK